MVKPNGSLEAVDLSDVDPDGVPDMNGILVHDGKAFVALGFLPPWDSTAFGDHATRRGALAVIDVSTRKRIDVIDLHGHTRARPRPHRQPGRRRRGYAGHA